MSGVLNHFSFFSGPTLFQKPPALRSPRGDTPMAYQPITLSLPAVFDDVEGGGLSYTLAPLPDWATFDSATRTLSGTPLDLTPLAGLVLTATSASGLSTSTPPFTITLEHVSTAPVLAHPILSFTATV